MCEPSVLAHLTKQVLAVDQLQRSAPQRTKREPQPRNLLLLAISDEPNDVALVEITELLETFPNAVSGPGPWHDKLHLAEVRQSAVIDVGDELISEKVSY